MTFDSQSDIIRSNGRYRGEMSIDKILMRELARENISNLLHEINKLAFAANLPELQGIAEETSKIEILIDPDD